MDRRIKQGLIIIRADEYTVERGFLIEAGEAGLSVGRDTSAAEGAGLLEYRCDTGEAAIAEQGVFFPAAETGERKKEIQQVLF